MDFYESIEKFYFYCITAQFQKCTSTLHIVNEKLNSKKYERFFVENATITVNFNGNKTKESR